MKKILVAGGAGYIGSVTVKKLLDKGCEVVVVDNLYKGRKELVDKRAVFIKEDILNLPDLEKKLKSSISKKKFDVIMHFAALKMLGNP